MKKIKLNTKEKRRRILVISKILFPEHKHVKYLKSGHILFYSGIKNWFVKKNKEKYSIEYLLDYLFVKKLCLFKYNNEQFIGEVYKQKESSKMNNISFLDFFYNEVMKLKVEEYNLDSEVFPPCDIYMIERTPEGKVYKYTNYILDRDLHDIRSFIISKLREKFNILKPSYYEITGTVLIILITFFLIR